MFHWFLIFQKFFLRTVYRMSVLHPDPGLWKMDFQFSIFQWKLEIENWKFSIIFQYSILAQKLKCAKMSFYISISNWKLNGTFGARIGFGIQIRVAKVTFHFFNKLKYEIRNKDLIFVSLLKCRHITSN